MTIVSQPKPVIVCCSVLEAEMEALQKKYWPDVKLRFLTSILHIYPEQLAASLEQVLERELKQGHGIVLIYGDCCAQMAAMEAMPGVVRTHCNNCCQLLLGREEYRRLSSGGAFFLIPEWTRRWREIFTKELGLNHANATSIMRDFHRKMVYLDTQIVPIPEKELLECAEYCGLPFEVRPILLDNLRSCVEEVLFKPKSRKD